MILTLHVISALASLLAGMRLFLAPSRKMLNLSYTLTAATLVSGTYLVANSHSALAPACVSGLLYLGSVATLIIMGKRKLANQNNL